MAAKACSTAAKASLRLTVAWAISSLMISIKVLALQAHATGRHRHDALDHAAPHADEVVVDVDGWVAVAGHQVQLFAELEFVVRVADDTVLVGGADVFDVVAAVDHGDAGIHALRLEAGIADGLFFLGLAHDRGVDEQAVVE